MKVIEHRSEYEKWIENIEKHYEHLDANKLQYQPKISILVPVYNVLDRHLIPCIESVRKQTYKNWELCLVDDCSTMENVKKTLNKYKNKDKRIKVKFRETNGHISQCTNTALDMATGEYIAFLDCDDTLAKFALNEVVELLNKNRDLDFIYSDEDKIDDEGLNRHMPHFKPDWSPDTLMSHMYTCHFGVYRTSIAREIGGDRKGYEGAQDYDFTLRFTEKTDKIAHIDKILYHWRERVESTAADAGAKPYILEAAKKTKEDALRRRGLKANLELVDGIYQYRVNYLVDGAPKVSVVIPSKDNYKILEKCITSFVEKTRYKNYEFILVDNGSSDENKEKYSELAKKYNITYIYEKMDFNFSKMCNMGVAKSTGDYILLLNDDIEIIDEEWLERMLGQAQLKHIGAVGAKLLYEGGERIQHIGVVNYKVGPSHIFAKFKDDQLYYFGRNKIDYNSSAVTAACLLVNKDKYNEVGGLDESLAVAYNDVDFCFKLVEKGYYNICRNDAVLIHYESISRGNDLIDKEKMRRLNSERDNLYKKHPMFNNYDPFYNSNLAQDRVDYSYNYSLADRVVVLKNIESFDENIYSKNSSGIAYMIDNVIVGKDIYVRGWMCTNNRLEGLIKRYIIFEDYNGKIVRVKLNRCKRNDVKGKQGIKYAKTGFEICVPRNAVELDGSKYKIALYSELPTGKKYYESTSEVVELL